MNKMLGTLIFFLFISTSLNHSHAQEKTLPYGQSIDKISSYFLNIPYCSDPLGEGRNGEFDQDPRCRTDGFDCQTFVETVLALNRSDCDQSFHQQMDFIRYHDDKISYANRCHFSEIQWIPDNIKRAVVNDITDQLPNSEVVEVEVDISAWYHLKTKEQIQIKDEAKKENLLPQFCKLGDQCPPQKNEISYIPVSKIDETLIKKIPSESIIFFLRKNQKKGLSTPIMVTHMGFVIDQPTGKILRHAALKKSVMDVSLSEYIAKFKTQESAAGIKLLQPVLN